MKRKAMSASLAIAAVLALAAAAEAQSYVNQRVDLSTQPYYSPMTTVPYDYALLPSLYASGNVRGGRAFQGQRNFLEDRYFNTPLTRFWRDSTGISDVQGGGGSYGPGVPMYQPGTLVSRGSTIDYRAPGAGVNPFGLLPAAGPSAGGYTTSVFYSNRPPVARTPAFNPLTMPFGMASLLAPETVTTNAGPALALTNSQLTALLGLSPELVGPQWSSLFSATPPNLISVPGVGLVSQAVPSRALSPALLTIPGLMPGNLRPSPTQAAPGQPATLPGQPGSWQSNPSYPYPNQPGMPQKAGPTTPGAANAPPGTYGYAPPQAGARLPGQANLPGEAPAGPGNPSFTNYLGGAGYGLSPELAPGLAAQSAAQGGAGGGAAAAGAAGLRSPEAQRLELLRQMPPEPQAATPGEAAAAAAAQPAMPGPARPSRAEEQYFQLGLIDLETGLFRQAADAFSAVSRVNPTRGWEAGRDEGLARLLAGDHYVAALQLSRSLVEKPDWTTKDFRVTALVNRPKDWQTAEEVLAAILKVSPESPAHTFDMAYLKIFTGRPAEAAPYLKTAAKNGDFASAVKVLEAIIKP